jgi:hypothetical protein
VSRPTTVPPLSAYAERGLGADFVLGPAVDRGSKRDSRRGMQRPNAIEVEIPGAAVNTLSTFLNTRKTRLKIKFDWNALRKL